MIYKPRLYVGDTDVKKVFVYETNTMDSHKLVKTIEPFVDYSPGSKEITLSLSVNHFSEKTKKLMEIFDNRKEAFNSGCGYRYLLMIEGKSDGYVQNRKGACKWDTCSGEAMLECLGGKSTAVEGSQYDYGKDASHINDKGQFALNSSKNHEHYSEKIREFMKENYQDESFFI